MRGAFKQLAHGLGWGLVATLGLSVPAQARDGHMISGAHRGLAYKLHVPVQLPTTQPPLVVMLHGCTQDPDIFATSTRMNRLADQAGFLVLYPAQNPLANPRRCWNWFLPGHQGRGRGEPGAIADLVEAIATERHVDRRRIYVAGLSAGGAMAAVLGANYPETFAAVAVCAGIPFGAAQSTDSALRIMAEGVQSPHSLPGRVLAAMGTRKRPVPLFIVQGSQDARVAPINGEQLARQWAGVYSLGPEPSEKAETAAQPGNRAVSRARWLDAQGQTVVERWLIQGLAHAWPGGDARGTHVDPVGPDASAAVWAFFEGRKR